MSVIYVNYTVDMGDGPKEFQSGPYKSEAAADDNRRDIASYVGISKCYLSWHRDERRTLVGAGIS